MGRIFAPFSLYLYLRDNSDGVETALAQWWRGFAADLTHKKKNPRMLSVEFNKKLGFSMEVLAPSCVKDTNKNVCTPHQPARDGLTDYSPSDKPWDTHRAQSDDVGVSMPVPSNSSVTRPVWPNAVGCYGSGGLTCPRPEKRAYGCERPISAVFGIALSASGGGR